MNDRLLSQHAALLSASAITGEVAKARGYRSVEQKARLTELGFSSTQARVPALLIPIWNVQGEIALYQTRADDPRIVEGKAVKYEIPRGSRMVLDVPPPCHQNLRNPKVPLFVTEGVRKADAAASVGLCCIALLGVWNFRGTNEQGGKTALPDWESIALNDRQIYIVFDSDVMTKTSVSQALARLKAFLDSRHAHVRLIYLPAGPNGAKVGLDDYLAAGHTIDNLLALVSDETLDATPSDENGPVEPAEDERRSQAARLVDLADHVELFHTPTGEPFATVAVEKHCETHPVRSTAFKGWLRRRYWDAYRQPAAGSAMVDAIETLAARAEFGGATHPVAIRIAEHNGRIYVDVANDVWQAVEIGPDGWRIVAAAPVKFRRPATMEPLPDPVRGGSLELLRPFVNVADDESWHLFAGFLVAAFRPSGPYLVLVLYGEQGSAKSTTTKIIRLLVDPGRSPLRAEPREQQDLLIAARNNWIVAFDNVSHFPPWMSDALCRLSTGGGLGKRQLYTDQDEIVLDAQRPQVINGITEFVTRGDLLDRSIIQEQPTIRDQSRRSEDELWREFEAKRPQIVGALFDAVSAALANHARVVLQELPRMADPTRWVTAAEPALGWPAGTFAAAYRHNRREGSALALDAALIAGPLVELAKRGTWQGAAAALLSKLGEIVGDEISGQREWPKNPRALTEALKRLAPDLRATGVEWTRLERTGNTRPHLIRWTGDTTVTTDTTDTARTNPNDGHALNVPEDRHSGDRTVTADRAPNDGHDGHDGPPPAPLLADPRVRPPILPSAVLAEESTLWTA